MKPGQVNETSGHTRPPQAGDDLGEVIERMGAQPHRWCAAFARSRILYAVGDSRRVQELEVGSVRWQAMLTYWLEHDREDLDIATSMATVAVFASSLSFLFGVLATPQASVGVFVAVGMAVIALGALRRLEAGGGGSRGAALSMGMTRVAKMWDDDTPSSPDIVAWRDLNIDKRCCGLNHDDLYSDPVRRFIRKKWQSSSGESFGMEFPGESAWRHRAHFD